jgi:hypothetical protein
MRVVRPGNSSYYVINYLSLGYTSILPICRVGESLALSGQTRVTHSFIERRGLGSTRSF